MKSMRTAGSIYVKLCKKFPYKEQIKEAICRTYQPQTRNALSFALRHRTNDITLPILFLTERYYVCAGATTGKI